MIDRWAAALVGALAAATALATSVLLDSLAESVPSLVLGVGQAIIRATPGDLAREGIEAAGTADKPIIVAGTVVLSIALGAGLGWVGRARAVVAGLLVAGVAGAVATAWATTAGGGGIAVATIGTVAIGALVATRLDRWVPESAGAAASAMLAGSPESPGSAASPESPTSIGLEATRRRFLVAAGFTGVGAGTLALLGRRLLQTPATEAARQSVTLPTVPAGPAAAAPVAPGAELGLEQLTPIITPNDDFYRIDEALLLPSVDLSSWRLRVEGLVDRPFELSYDELVAEPLVERYVTLACVSNEVGGGLIGTARWLGVPLAHLLERAGVQAGADQLVGRSVDGFTVGFPTALALDGRDALVAIGMNGEPLPRRHGFPARLIVPGLYGYVSATKWLRSIELTTWDAFDPYWIERGWAAEGPIKTQSRIDVPRHGATVDGTAGAVVVAGVAWAPHRGIERVEVRVDGGAWQPATLADPITTDTWRQWRFDWDAADVEPGRHTLEVRATDGTGEPQDEERRPVFPDGATGFHTIDIDVS